MMLESKKATGSLEIHYRGQGGPERLIVAQKNECSEGLGHPSVCPRARSAEWLTGASILMSARRSLSCDARQLTWPLADSEGVRRCGVLCVLGLSARVGIAWVRCAQLRLLVESAQGPGQ
jgi:hypothetical protein